MGNSLDPLELYSVTVAVIAKIHVPVVACSKEHAELIAKQNFLDHLEKITEQNATFIGERLEDLPVDFEGELAYWDPVEAGDPRAALACEFWFGPANEASCNGSYCD